MAPASEVRRLAMVGQGDLLAGLQKRFGLSRAAAAIRLRELGLAVSAGVTGAAKTAIER